MARIRTDNVFGTTTNAPLLIGGTTLNSAGLANLAAVAGADRAVITLDPNRVNGAPEIVYVSAHTGAATSATILRGQEGTAAREHPLGTFWVHAITALDMRLLDRVGASLARAAVQSIPDAAETAISWDTENFDSDGFIAVPATTLTVPAGFGGLYAITARGSVPTQPTVGSYSYLTAGGNLYLAHGGAVAGRHFNVGITVPLVAADTVLFTVYQDHTGAQNFTGHLFMNRVATGSGA